MANLIVRNLDDALVRKLKQRAVKHARSAEAEHRAILEEALAPTMHKSFADLLAAMPNVGRDEDFERCQDKGRDAPNVFD
jgi:plasmid stability protein